MRVSSIKIPKTVTIEIPEVFERITKPPKGWVTVGDVMQSTKGITYASIKSKLKTLNESGKIEKRIYRRIDGLGRNVEMVHYNVGDNLRKFIP